MFAIAQGDGETPSRGEEREELEPAPRVTGWQCLKDKNQRMDAASVTGWRVTGGRQGDTVPQLEGVGGRCWWKGENPPTELPLWRTLFLLFLLAVLMEELRFWASTERDGK